MTKLDFTKKAVGLVVGFGTGKIVKTIISNNVPMDSVTDQVTVTAGSIVLGSMVGDLSTRYTDVKIDQIADWWKRNVK